MRLEQTKTRVLIIEDSHTQAMVLRQCLVEAGYVVDVASNGFKGLDALAASRFDLVLTDIQMPGMNGYEVCQKVKATPAWASLPVILLTSFGQPVDFIRGLECGADAFVNKPYEGPALLGRIAQILESRDRAARFEEVDGPAEMVIQGERFRIDASKPRILNFLAATFEDFARTKQREHSHTLEHERHRAESELHRAREEHLLREQEALNRSRAFLQASLDALSARIAIVDERGRILAVNEAWGRSEPINPLVGPHLGVGTDYLAACTKTAATLGSSLAIATGISTVLSRRREAYELEYACQKAGTGTDPVNPRWYCVRVTRFHDADPARVVVAHEEITQRKLAEEQLRHHAFHDTLTGLSNRALLENRLEDALHRLQRRAGGHLALLFLDFDGFKLINDSLGHEAGDQLLVAISRRLEGALRRVDSVARLGGDEFVVLAESLANVAEARGLAERIQDSLHHPFVIGRHELFITASIGIALAHTGKETPGELLRDADTAMYQAKALGRGRHALFDVDMHTRILHRLKLESDLGRALEHGEFRVVYQPIISLAEHRLVGFEALIRWLHPERGWVSPVDFIPIAEETQLILPLGLWVLRQACRQLVDWSSQWPEASGWYMGVNLSGRQLLMPDLIDRMSQAIADVGSTPDRLRLEVTETVAMGDSDTAIAMLSGLRALGIRVALDDFGTGYSSLSYLHRLPLDALKIDRSFVGRLDQPGGDDGIVRTILALAANLNLDVVAEGIETRDQLARLHELGCPSGQGYLFAKPLEATALHRWLAEHCGPRSARPMLSIVA